MTAATWDRVRDVFEQALDRDGREREIWMAEVADGEPAVAEEVKALLDQHSRAGQFLEEPAPGRVAFLLEDDSRFEEGQVVGPYTIGREIGRGGMGRVYRATDTRLGRPVALKVLPPALARDPRERERLRREARAAASLTHPGICTVFAFEQVDDEVFIVSELVEGQTLRAAIEVGARPSADDVMDAARQMSSALASAHEIGLTHRDLKPENIMRQRDGRLKILDFGLALVEPAAGGNEVESRLTRPGGMVGTPAYMAPEQLTGAAADVRTDVFALGVLLYEYATGFHPFAAQTAIAQAAAVLHGEPRALTAARPDLPQTLVNVVLQCLRKAPGDRFSSATAVAGALEGVPQKPEVPYAPGRPATDVAQWWRGHQVAAIVLYVAAVTAAWATKEMLHGVADTGFLLVGVAAMAAGVFRGHLLFAERVNHASFAAERRRANPATLAADLVIAFALAAEGFQVTASRPVAGLLTIALGVAIGLIRVVIEPSTTRGAFGPDSKA